MNDIEEQAVNTYNYNMQYLQNEHTELAKHFFNTQDSTNTKHHLKKFHKMIILGLDNIQTQYEDALSTFVQEHLNV